MKCDDKLTYQFVVPDFLYSYFRVIHRNVFISSVVFGAQVQTKMTLGHKTDRFPKIQHFAKKLQMFQKLPQANHPERCPNRNEKVTRSWCPLLNSYLRIILG